MNNLYAKSGYAVCKIIADSINNRSKNYIQCDSKVDFSERIDFIKKHNLVSIWSSVIRKKGHNAQDDYEKYGESIDDCNHHIFRQMKFDSMREKVSKHLSSHHVRHIILKGCTTDKFYPSDVIRTSADVDIFVDKRDFESAKEALQELGFYFEKTHDNEEFHFKKDPRYYIEVHTTLEGFSDRQKKILLKLSDNAVKVSGERFELTDSDAYIYSMFHLYKHFVFSGVGVRMFLDNYLIEKNGNIDLSYTEKIFKELEIDGFIETVRKINKVLFENDVADEKLKEVINFVFDSGVFGKCSTKVHLDEMNRTTKHQSKLERFSINNGLSFLSMSKRYPILKKIPVLYPFSFIHRFFYGIIHKRDVLKKDKELKEALSKDRINKYRKIFEIANIRM